MTPRINMSNESLKASLKRGKNVMNIYTTEFLSLYYKKRQSQNTNWVDVAVEMLRKLPPHITKSQIELFCRRADPNNGDECTLLCILWEKFFEEKP